MNGMTLQDFLILIQDEDVRIELEIDDGSSDEYKYHHFWLSDFRTNDDIVKYYRYYNVSSFSFEPEEESNAQMRIFIKI